ncbi:N-acetyltransferase [Actinoplanes sp. TBRC 11911]|uniref:GNAT family N-acetyltransferase n=1 Tax=Actinoplanes sp. TBRC 11911 TaxID=2729386 RepID=UPI00145E124A|nr:GNAT family N-acetyltransferase [Actinoplanes sp. TBRC 11911]NMO51396.1 N-acetyltransferase [Actinoplanes sp. TBRC 11911]
MSDIDVRDVPGHSRFELLVDGEYAGRADYRLRDGLVVIVHSEVEEQFRGKGLASVLVRRTLDLLRADGAKAKLVCPYFAAWHEKHPDEYADIIVD